MSPGALTVAVLLGAAGLAYLVYGRRQRRAVPFLSGLGLISLPYLVEPLPGQLLGGALLLALPAFLRF